MNTTEHFKTDLLLPLRRRTVTKADKSNAANATITNPKSSRQVVFCRRDRCLSSKYTLTKYSQYA